MKEPGKTEGPCAIKKLCTISGLHLQNQATLVQICSFKNNALSHGLEVKRNNFPSNKSNLWGEGGGYNGLEGEVDSRKDVAGTSEKQN